LIVFKILLDHNQNSVNMTYTNLTRDRAFDYFREKMVTKYSPDAVTGNALETDVTYEVLGVGLPLLEQFAQFGADGLVLLMEGKRATREPLRLTIEMNGRVVAESRLDLRLSGVESMYRHLNLRDGEDAATGVFGDKRGVGLPSRMGEPIEAFPDRGNAQPWFVFVGGSNVDGESTRGWESETFKRLYWSREDDGGFFAGRYLGVSWFGDPYQDSSEEVYDYHLAVRNAFGSADELAAAVNGLPGSGSIAIAGHSLACGLIAAAVEDHAMDVNRVIFIDAAIARETFDGRVGSGAGLSDEELGMTPSAWRDYDPRLMATNWHESYSGLPSDARSQLTWRNRFLSVLPKAYNFYSSTEDVLGAYDGDVPSNALGVLATVLEEDSSFKHYVWVYQEKAKGKREDIGFPGFFDTHVGSTYMGWGTNLKDPLLPEDPLHWNWVETPDVIGRFLKPNAELINLSDSVLRRHPVFDPGWGVVRVQADRESPVSDISPADYAPDWIYELYLGISGSELIESPLNQNRLLSEAIPAMSLPLGASSSLAFEERNYDMPSKYTTPDWPRGKINGVFEWKHSDMREVAFLYQAEFWDAMVSISQQP
jgi:hypothetical protein